ncbi:MAG: hypothetical protein QFB86_01395 [Patescibacteria group bacterium]|nr:hypothetical protein [Patescibacteria group bacterium]
MVKSHALYNDITKISEDYFGPAAPRFVSRIITNHLGKRPEDVTHKDVPELLTWMKLTMAMVTDKPEVVREFAGRINELS